MDKDHQIRLNLPRLRTLLVELRFFFCFLAFKNFQRRQRKSKSTFICKNAEIILVHEPILSFGNHWQLLFLFTHGTRPLDFSEEHLLHPDLMSLPVILTIFKPFSFYNGSYTMMAKLVRTLQLLHYPIIQFLIMNLIYCLILCCCVK